MEMAGLLPDTTTPPSRYSYNNKEQEEGVGLYDYGMRRYDGVIGRFGGVDRFSENYAFQSPFAYAANNPISFIDVNGDSTRIYTTEGELMGTINDSYPNEEHFFGSKDVANFYLSVATGENTDFFAKMARASSNYFVGANTRNDLRKLSSRGVSEGVEAYGIGVLLQGSREIRILDLSDQIPISKSLQPCNHCRNPARVSLAAGFAQSLVGEYSNIKMEAHTHGYYSVLARMAGMGVSRSMHDNIRLVYPSYKDDYDGSTLEIYAKFGVSTIATKHGYSIFSIGLPWTNDYQPLNFGQGYSYDGNLIECITNRV